MNKLNEEYGSLKVVCPYDCGNAPKKKLLQELTIAIAKNDQSFILEHLKDDVCWDIVGNKQIQGNNHVVEILSKKEKDRATELHINNIITHGSTGSINGIIILESKKRYAFCDIYNFTSAGKTSKIKEITSFLIEVK
ncbi:hypothetical protein MKZ08_07325 [Viridibacillus sp. FSL R5-0477]|uniref:DNA-binding protein n=1 Tax=Viridibacillus arenosi FSL R5-213 TaxID=1227360 RepID=W4EXQ4_9BACL|nr:MULTISPECIES: hypothetical protein [Viridibacillus]ETT85325.1 hypothetical protein C176_11529 [Viridibacillus arenosi FSL R5-213]OMC80957.1 hypothetical protein BK130_16680 [Viridibacillus sp. FSL H8-0123]OMC86609.1 hypothetical protein BK128_11155 [Viridibacillus sp. FSL H7-0596]OMC89385.1 hypothetical protein BK137_18240 [Viridibacillus arenosi]